MSADSSPGRRMSADSSTGRHMSASAPAGGREPGRDPGRWLIRASFLVIIGFIAWANWAEIDQITRAPGQAIASSRNQVVQAPEGGVLAELLVREGSSVRRGQLLFRFERNKAEAGSLEAEAKVVALKAAVARLRAELLGGKPVFGPELRRYPEFTATQQALFDKRQSALAEELAALARSQSLVRDELEMNLPLLRTGDVSRAEVLKLQRQLAEIEGQITNRRNKYLQDSQTEFAKAQEDLAAAEQVLAQRREQLGYTEVRAPMDGVVRNVRLTTVGGVARPGEEILQIVPVEDSFLFEAKVRPADAAFVKTGLPATVKLDAYDYTIYGSLPGEVTYISVDTLSEDNRANEQPYYRVQIRTTARNLVAANGRRIDIQPGMTASIEIRTGSNTVLRFLLKPVIKTLHEALGER
ncbi:MAG: HlyD family efflux transporter periplasmic adaptor subunit [Burkholderiales bacterium]|jgi:adhesin transport system membrane fusion protein